MRQVDRGLKKSQREIEREIHKLQMEEKKTLTEIKKLAGQGQTVRPPDRPTHADCTAALTTACNMPHCAADQTGRLTRERTHAGAGQDDGEAGGAAAEAAREAVQG